MMKHDLCCLALMWASISSLRKMNGWPRSSRWRRHTWMRVQCIPTVTRTRRVCVTRKRWTPHSWRHARLPSLTSCRLFINTHQSCRVMAGEVGPHSHGGLNGCTNRFANSFWYLEVLGSLASRGVVAFARSTLIGGWYEMINKTTFEPNPDYYAALLWGYMMGYEHLNVSVTGSSAVHAFASYTDNGIVAVILNTDAKNDVMVTVNHVQLNSHPDDQEQIEYHIRAHNNDPFSDKVEILLSSGEWQVLEASDEGVPPQLGGITNKLQPINMPAMSYAFVTLSPVIILKNN